MNVSDSRPPKAQSSVLKKMEWIQKSEYEKQQWLRWKESAFNRKSRRCNNSHKASACHCCIWRLFYPQSIASMYLSFTGHIAKLHVLSRTTANQLWVFMKSIFFPQRNKQWLFVTFVFMWITGRQRSLDTSFQWNRYFTIKWNWFASKWFLQYSS